MDKRPIGVFDSGVGGLTAVLELHKILPGEDIIYFGDTARVPYGTRSRETVCKYATQIVHFLASQKVKAMVVACGTISTNLSGAEITSAAPNIPHITLVDPSVQAALAATRTGRIGVMATPATIRTNTFNNCIAKSMPQAEVLGVACPLLVPLVENGMTNFENQITRLTLEMYLQPLRDFGVDTLILGCTHYPLLLNIVGDMMPGVTLIDSGACAARATKQALEQGNLLSKNQTGSTIYYMTDTINNFASVAKKFLFEDIEDQCHHILIEELDNF